MIESAGSLAQAIAGGSAQADADCARPDRVARGLDHGQSRADACSRSPVR